MSLKGLKHKIKRAWVAIKRGLESNTTAELLEELSSNIQLVGQDWSEMHQNTLEVAAQIQRDTPEVPGQTTRTKMFFGNPFAWIGKSLFYLASNSDVKRLALGVQHLRETQEGNLDQFKSLKEDATSFMCLSNE